jgi:hypothetical protein
MKVTQPTPTRKQRFDAALKLAGMTLDQWCADQKVTRQHLNEGFKGNRDFGADLDARIDQFISTHLVAA